MTLVLLKLIVRMLAILVETLVVQNDRASRDCWYAGREAVAQAKELTPWPTTPPRGTPDPKA